MQHDPSATSAASGHSVLLLGAGARPYREYFLQRIAIAHRVVLADRVPPAWARPYVHRQMVIDISDTEGTAAVVKRLADQTPLGGICTYMDHYAEPAARLAELLSLPGNSPASVAACSDKAETRRRLDEHGIPSARWRLVADEEAAVECARELGYPVVVKPRAMNGSARVVRADSDAEARDAYRRVGWETVLGLEAVASHGVLVEEYVAGSEIGAETVVLRDEVRIVAITRKRLGPEPRFQELGHSVDARDPLLNDPAVTQAVARTVRALGIEHGVLHIELRLTKRGPVVIDCDATPGGDLIPLLVARATGIDLVQAAAALATGGVPDLSPKRRQAAAVQFLHAARSGEVTHLSAPAALQCERWLDRLIWTRHPGDRVWGPPNGSVSDRLAHWVVTGADHAECDRRLASVLSRITARISTPLRTTRRRAA